MLFKAVIAGRLLVCVVLAASCSTTSDTGARKDDEPVAQAGLPDAASRSEVRAMVDQFAGRRLHGSGAEKYLDRGGRAVFGHSASLGPLYPPAREFEIVFVDGLDGSYEVGVDLTFERGSVGDTLFVSCSRMRCLVTGGRPGLTGP
jgi:hypothetical protein